LYFSLNIIGVIKSRRMGWAGHLACMGDIRNVYNILVRKHEEKDYSEDLGADKGRVVSVLL
jgi:hypothetical protein